MIELAFTQHCGLATRVQQDALLAADLVMQSADLPVRLLHLDAADGFCALADGVAASPCPERASRTVLEALRDVPREGAELLQEGWIGPRLIRRRVHARLCQALGQRSRTQGAAATLALAQWQAGRIAALNVGDSRIYRIDPDGAWRLLSRDHTYFQSMVARGELAPDQSVGQLYHDLEHMLIADPEEDGFDIHWERTTWTPGTTLLLCTDGVHDTLGDSRLRAIGPPDMALDVWAERLRAAVLDAGAPDNFSLILARNPATIDSAS